MFAAQTGVMLSRDLPVGALSLLISHVRVFVPTASGRVDHVGFQWQRVGLSREGSSFFSHLFASKSVY